MPDLGSALDQKPHVQATKFGDGYEVRTVMGINSNPESWSLVFSLSPTNTVAALTFLKARNAVESFYWQSPYNVTSIFVCREWKTDSKGGFYTLTCTFEQVFEF